MTTYNINAGDGSWKGEQPKVVMAAVKAERAGTGTADCLLKADDVKNKQPHKGRLRYKRRY
jgi:hypothetical protein